MRDKKIEKSFCVLPWIHSFVNLGGEYQVCCTGEEFSNYVLDKNKERMNISGNHSVDEVMNSQYMKDFRLNLLDGKLPRECSRCAITEKSSGVSRRMIENEEYAHIVDALIENTKSDGSIDPKIFHADYRLGNICNLKCRMCHPRASKKWVKDYNDMPDDMAQPVFKENIEKYKNYDWTGEDFLLDDFKNKVMTMERLHFGGGEPLYNPKMIEMLELCVEVGRAKHMTISYNTNLTILNDKILNLWKEFKEVKLLISIDGYGKLNDYIRYPSKWSDVDKNLKYLDENYKTYNISEIMVSTTVQANNILYLDKLYNYLKDFKFVVKAPNFIRLYFPIQLSFMAMPRPLVMMAIAKTELLIRELEANSEIKEYMVQNLKQIKNSLANTLGQKVNHFEGFKKYTKFYDEKNGLNLFDVNPELQKFMKENI